MSTNKAFALSILECRWHCTDGTNALQNQEAKISHAVQILELFFVDHKLRFHVLETLWTSTFTNAKWLQLVISSLIGTQQ
jgi:hypothetical protein